MKGYKSELPLTGIVIYHHKGQKGDFLIDIRMADSRVGRMGIQLDIEQFKVSDRGIGKVAADTIMACFTGLHRWL